MDMIMILMKIFFRMNPKMNFRLVRWFKKDGLGDVLERSAEFSFFIQCLTRSLHMIKCKKHLIEIAFRDTVYCATTNHIALHCVSGNFVCTFLESLTLLLIGEKKTF